jgi:hypothetical protein
MITADMKILGVGLSRTATSSLSAALTTLGYRSVHFDVAFSDLLDEAGKTGVLDLSRYDAIDALTDVPAALFYEDFLVRYPDLKIILTVRDETAWLNSIVENFKRLPVSSPSDPVWRDSKTTWHGRLLSFGTPVPNRYLLLRAYRAWTKRVIHDIPSDRLLVMDIPAGDGWGPLCRFLGQPIPEMPFPWLNRHT